MTLYHYSFTDLYEVTDSLMSAFKILFLRSFSVTNTTQYKCYGDTDHILDTQST